MNLHSNRLFYKKVKSVKFLTEVLKGKLYEVDFFHHDTKQIYDTDKIDYVDEFGSNREGKIHQIKPGEFLIDLK